jgi:hypothetical protein
MKQPAMEWRPAMDCWLLRTETPLSERHVDACRDFMLKIQAGRRIGLIPGDIRDDLDASVRALRENRIKQWAAGPSMDGRGEITVFGATQGTGKTIMDMGA